TGFELAQMVKERRKTAHVPIIFLTAYYDKDQHVQEGYGSGAVDFLNKPVNPAVLRSKVAVFADLHRKNRAIQLANRALLAEVHERRLAEERLRELNDTLEQRVAERTDALRAADRRLQAIMGSITDGLVTLDRHGCFTYVNEQGATLLGVPAARMIGACVWDLFPQLLGTAFEQGFRQAVDSGQSVSFEGFYAGAPAMWFQCHCYPSVDGLSVYFHDITDRRELQSRREQLLAAEQAARNEGERVAQAKDEFLALLSHELRTPLAAIVGWANVLTRPDVDAQTLRRGIEAIGRNARIQTHLVADLLDMSRIVSGKLHMSIERVDLNAVATAAADSARLTGQGKALSIELHLADGDADGGADGLLLLGDAARLSQIVSNLLTNAIKFTPPGGRVTISTARRGEQIELAVADTGQGIAAEFLPHLFDRFSQADGSAAREHGGLGLGLSIVKNLVELHAGSVSAASPGPGRGATFTLRFARADEQAPVISAAPAGEMTANASGAPAGAFASSGPAPLDLDLAGVRVLLVEDHADVMEVERRLLHEAGALVTTASSAELALQALQNQAFDVLLSDLGMPGMDGYELIAAVRSELGLDASRLPAAAITAFVRPQDQRRALDKGYQRCLQKPLTPASLARVVGELLALRAPEPADAAVTPAAARSQRLRTLFVEDHPELREQIGWLLAEQGLDVISSASAEEAWLIYQQGDFELLITDISLPRMSGMELAQRVLAQRPQAWVIFSTGHSLDARLGQLGPHVRHLAKPCELEQLDRLIAEARADLRPPR
ncbi:MAG: response regulator, partial [Burkholderiaceae bacterium]